MIKIMNYKTFEVMDILDSFKGDAGETKMLLREVIEECEDRIENLEEEES